VTLSRRLFLAGTAAGIATPAWARTARKVFLDVHEEWTREVRIYNGFFTALLARGTWLSPEFRVALAEERRRVFDPTPEDHQAFVSRMQSEGAQYHEVVIGADSPYREANQFGAQGDDRWNLRLEADGRVLPCVEVVHVRRPTPLQRHLYPQVNIWSELWLARFENQVTNPVDLRLHVGGGYGNGEMAWRRSGPAG
jgi:hypothetical protein